MPAKQAYIRPDRLFFISFLLVPFGLIFSRALLSMVTLVWLICIVWIFIKRVRSNEPLFRTTEGKYLFPLVLLFILGLSEFFREGDFKDHWDRWFSQIGVWVFSLAAILFRHQYSDRIKDRLLLFMSLIFSVTGLITVFNYFRRKDELNALLLQSKHIPVFGGMNHIYFGLFLALLACFLLFSLPYWHERKRRGSFWLGSIGLLLILIEMHILSSRTGLLSFYVALFSSALWLLGRGRVGWKKWMLLLVIAIGLPMLAYNSFSSFRNKVANSSEDVQAMRQGGEEINHKSMAMRIESYRVGSQLFLEHWILGIGKEQVKPAMQTAYIKYKSPLYPENRIEPHNQFLQSGIAWGIAGMVVWLFFWLLPLFDLRAGFHPIYIAFLTLSFVAMMLEPLAERQWGMFFFFFFYFWLPDWKKDDFLISFE